MKITGHVGRRSAAWVVLFILSSGFAAVGCGGDEAAPQSPTGRAYDELSHAVAGCAGQLSSCRSDAGTRNPMCQSNFQTCALSAGVTAEQALVAATSNCLATSQKCDSQADGDAAKELQCDQRLRACLGEPSPPSGSASGRPGESASTFQCFGQLRDCISSDEAPKACSGAARDCVIHAISEPGSIPLPRAGAGAAGRGDSVAGRGGRNSGDAGRSGLAGRGGRNSGDAGDEASAGRGTSGRRRDRSSGTAGGADMRDSNSGAAQAGAGGSP